MPVFQPSFIVDTGGKSLHFYWRLSRMVSPEKFEEMQKRLVKLIKKVNPNTLLQNCIFLPLPATNMFKDAIELGYKPPNTLKEWSER